MWEHFLPDIPEEISPCSCVFPRHWTPHSLQIQPCSPQFGEFAPPQSCEGTAALILSPFRDVLKSSGVPLSPEQPPPPGEGAMLEPGAKCCKPTGFPTSLLLHPLGSVWSQGLSQAVRATHGLLLTLPPHPSPPLPQKRSWSQNFPVSCCSYCPDYLLVKTLKSALFPTRVKIYSFLLGSCTPEQQ